MVRSFSFCFLVSDQRPTGPMGKGNKHNANTKSKKWLDSYDEVSSWIEKKCPDFERLLEEHGLVKIEDFLPPFVADGILALLENIDGDTWNLTSAQDDYVHNNIRHSFLSLKQGVLGLEDVFRVFTLLLPDSLFTFSAAKYCKDGHIVPHDDRAYTNVLMEDGSVQLCSRNIACIYYLTKDWPASDGGQLVDLEAAGGPQVHVPKYNSLVAFTIPRWHEVRPVTGSRPRYSIFGWFLEPGTLYELNVENETTNQQQEEKELYVTGPEDDILQQKQKKQHIHERHQQQRTAKKKKRDSSSAQAPHQHMQQHLNFLQPKLQQKQAIQRIKKQNRKRLKELGTTGEVVPSLTVPEHSGHVPKQRKNKRMHKLNGGSAVLGNSER